MNSKFWMQKETEESVSIIKNQQKPTLESVQVQLEEQWSCALGAYKNQGAAPTGPAH